MTTLRLVVDTGFVGAQHEDYIDVPDEEWAAMSPEERNAFGYEAAETLRDNHVEAYYEVEDN